jgi:hypothetical protein
MVSNSSQDNAQAAYMADLIKAAEKEKAQKILKSAQGSLLVEVDGVSTPKNLGIEPTLSTLVRLDLHKTGKESGSVISLQEEFYFHLALTARVYGEIAVDLSPTKNTAVLNSKALLDLTKEAHQAAMTEVNRHIKRAYLEASHVAKEKEGFNLEKFNASLDKSRKKIAPIAHTILMEKLIEKTGLVFTDKDFKKAKHIAENTPATTQDILYVNQAEGLVTLIKGSKYTAHFRLAGKEAFAHRQIITCRIDKNGKITPGLHPRIQIRTPSPIVKKGLKKEAIISDVAEKLSEITDVYEFEKKLSDKKLKVFVYNRYTAINDKLGDTGGNLQTQSATHILQGAHQYNAKSHVFCFVQNISVNGFGDTLSYNSRDALVRESTLMAEMALMHTLCDTPALNKLLDGYKTYLKTSPREPYFSETEHGKAAITQIQAIKNTWKDEVETRQAAIAPVSAAKMSLKNLVAHDAHLTHTYAKLIQTLSVFSEKASIGGCKSGNERAQAINGRVLMLDGMKPGSEIEEKLINLARAPKLEALTAADALNTCINEQYNKKGLYAAASVISLVDQGASAKVEAKPKEFYISRNFAEESAKQMTNLKQSKAGAMQAHKGLTKYMRGAWSDYMMSDWFYMSSSFLGVFGAVAATVTVVPAILASLKNRQNKYHKTEARRMRNERIKDLENCDPENKVRIKDWLNQIGKYDSASNTLKNLEYLKNLNKKAKQALYRSTHKGITPKGAREDFIRFLGLKFLEGNALDRAVAPSNKAVTLKKLLGGEGFRLYKKAIKEEGKSKAFRAAVFSKSLKSFDGNAWSKRLILWVGGPSSSGKTYSAMNVLNYLRRETSNPLGVHGEDEPGNGVVFADGSFDREVSQMRQMVLQCALASGYKGVSDLYKHGGAIMLREYLKDTALASEQLSLVIPETFTRPGAAIEMSRYESLTKNGKFVQFFSEIKAEQSEDKSTQLKNDQRFRTAVKNMGELRAWRTEPFKASEIQMNNMNIGCESKVYEAKNFMWGRNLTKAYKRMYKERSQGKSTLEITNDLMYLQKNTEGNWQECVFDKDLTGEKKGVDFLFMPARAYNAWFELKEKKPGLVEWYEANKENEALTGPLIEFKENEKYKSTFGQGFFAQRSGLSGVAPKEEPSKGDSLEPPKSKDGF